MTRLITWFTRGVRATLTRRAGNDDIADELAFHLTSRIDDLMRRGKTRDQATRQARLEFGSRDKTADECRDAARFTFIEDIARDCRHSVRSLRKHPGLVAISVASLALGIGVNTLLFGAIQATFLAEPSGADPGHLAWVTPAGGQQLSFLNYQDLARSDGFVSLAGYRPTRLSLRGEAGRIESVTGIVITPNLFRTLGISPALGHDLDAATDTGAIETIVISHGFWKSRFVEDPAAIGQSLVLNGRSYRIAGILADDYIPIIRLLEPDIYVPVSSAVLPGVASRDNANALNLVARLHADNGKGRALTALTSVGSESLDPGAPAGAQRLRPATLTMLGSLLVVDGPVMVKLFPLVLTVLSSLVLLIATANVAGLLLARAMSQRHEFALLSALGASRRRIMQRIFSDSLVLSATSAVGALLLTSWLMPWLQDLVLPGIGVIHLRMHVSWSLAAFAAGLMLAAGGLCGLVPALSATRRDPAHLLRQGVVLGITSRLRVRQTLVVIETAATVVLLVAAFLFARTLVRLSLVDTGLDLDHGVVASVELRPGEARTERLISDTERLVADLRALPGVHSAGVTENIVPLTMEFSSARFAPEDAPQSRFSAMQNSVGPGYFAAIGQTLLGGRDFATADRAGSPPVVVVNERFASRFFEGHPLGHRIRSGGEPWADIVGVVSNNSVHNAGEDPPYAQVFYSWAQRPVSTQQRPVNIVVRSDAPDVLLRPVQALAATLVVDAPTNTRTLRDATAFEMSVRVASVRLLTTLGTLGLLLAAIGLYGIVSYLVVSQATELGVKMALGASPPMVLREVLWRGMRLTLWGLGAGMVCSLVGARMLTSLLVGLSPVDPVSFIGSALLLILMGVMATSLPARRATRTDPMVALKQN